MKTVRKSFLALVALGGVIQSSYAQVPSTNDTSDANFNTGMGTDALGGPTPLNLTGGANTASGYQALNFNTSGSANTASGTGALYSNRSGGGNTASGTYALYNNQIGNNNTALGYYALSSN